MSSLSRFLEHPLICKGMFSFDLLLAVLTILFILVLGSYFVSLIDFSLDNQLSAKDKQTKLLLISNKLIRRDLVVRDSSSFYVNNIDPNKLQDIVSHEFINYHNLSYFSILLNSNEFSAGQNNSENKYCIRRIVLVDGEVGYVDVCMQ